MRGWRARCVGVGYPIPSARAAVRKVPLGGDNLGPGRGKNSRSLREDANGPDAGLWAPRIMKRYAWKVFSFRLLLCTSEWKCFDAQWLSRGKQFVVEKRWGTRDVEEEKGKWVRTKGRSWVGKMEGGVPQNARWEGAWTTCRRKGNRRESGKY